MRKGVLALVCVLAIAAAAYLTYAQADHQVEDKGYIDIGSYKDTAANPRPNGSLYHDAAVTTYRGKPPKPFLQADSQDYVLDVPPAEDRSKPYDHHDLTHTWEGIAGNGLGKTPPMTAAAKASRASHITDDADVYVVHKPTNDPVLTCDGVGYPRDVVNLAYEFFQLPTVTLYHAAWRNQWEKVWTDGRPLPTGNLDPTWAGYNVGKWVGDTFVWDTNGVDSRVWLDGGGLGISGPDAQFQSRWRRIDHNTLQTNLTIRDPKFYLGGDWNTPDRLSQLYPNLELDINPCVPSDEFEYRNNSPTETPTPGVETRVAQ